MIDGKKQIHDIETLVLLKKLYSSSGSEMIWV